MTIGDKRSVRCGDGIQRTGTVIYIHPRHIFAVLEFPGRMGLLRESIYLRRPTLEINEKSNYARIERKRYSKDDDRTIMSTSAADAAKALGRTNASIWQRRAVLKRRGQTK